MTYKIQFEPKRCDFPSAKGCPHMAMYYVSFRKEDGKMSAEQHFCSEHLIAYAETVKQEMATA